MTYKIILNGEEKEVVRVMLSYDFIVELAWGPQPKNSKRIFTVVWRSRVGDGSLIPGQSVLGRPRMIFSVVETSNS